MADQKTGNRSDYNDPDKQNSEQNDEPTQAQTYAKAALGDAWHERMSRGSTKERGRDPTLVPPTNEQDLIDHMTDMDAYAGEPDSMDDEDGSIDETGAPSGGADRGTDTVSEDALKRGLTPSEMMAGEEPEDRTEDAEDD